jgi:hypothetical protein
MAHLKYSLSSYITPLTFLTVVAAASDLQFGPDPAADVAVSQKKLSADDEKACRELFQKLASEDFDVRDQAISKLVSRGLAVLPLADEFARSTDAEIVTQAKSLYRRIICEYDGYLPPNPALMEALEKPFTEKLEYSKETLARVAKEAGVTVLLEDNAPNGLNDLQMDGVSVSVHTVGEALSTAAAWSGGIGIPRANAYLVASRETAGKLSRQRQMLDWSALQMDRDEANHVAQALHTFFPPESTEIHVGTEVLTVQGNPEAIPRAARLIALLKPNVIEGIWPAPPGTYSSRAVLEELSAPVNVSLKSEAPYEVVEQLTRQKHPVALVRGDAPNGEALDLDKFAAHRDPAIGDILELTDVQLALHQLPLGLALHWVERRSKFINNTAPRVLGFETGPNGRLQIRVQHKPRPSLENAIGGADVSFLYLDGAAITPDADKEVRKTLLKALESHLALFPTYYPERDFAVVRGRALIQAPWATAQRAVELIRQWRTSGQPPAPSEWFAEMQKKLETPMEWDGRALRGKQVLSTIVNLFKINLLMEAAPDGRAPEFVLKDASLLAPGPHTLHELLDELTTRVNANWSVELGTIVLTPKPETAGPGAKKAKNEKAEW